MSGMHIRRYPRTELIARPAAPRMPPRSHRPKPLDRRDSQLGAPGRHPSWADHVRVADTSHAWAPAGSTVTSILDGSIESTLHPSEKLALISAWLMRRGPQSPGWRSLK